MNLLLIILCSLSILAVIGLGHFVIQLKRRLVLWEEKQKEHRSTDPEIVTKLKGELSELRKLIDKGREDNDRELNNLWEELENLRRELLQRFDQGVTIDEWQTIRQNRIPSYQIIREHLAQILVADAELAEQLRTNLPAYLISDQLLTGILDLARTPFDRINWMERLIIPVSAKLDSNEQLQKSLIVPFDSLLKILGFQAISPASGETYRPDWHEVVEQRLSNSPRGTVLTVRARGYSQQNTILRKAKVVISAGN